jgi:DNA polymerase V
MDSGNSVYKITGFQSACAEYHEEMLSLDVRYDLKKASVFIIEVSGSSRPLGIRTKDKLIVDRSLHPRLNDLVIMVQQNEFQIMLFNPHLIKQDVLDGEDFIWGVVIALLRDFK